MRSYIKLLPQLDISVEYISNNNALCEFITQMDFI